MKPEYFNIAIKNLRKRKLRSWLTVIGIFISIATIFLLISLSLGLQDAVKEQFRQLGADKFFIMPRGQFGPPGASGGAVQLTTKDVNVIEKVSGVKDLTYNVIGNAEIKFMDEKKYLMVIGFPLDKSEVISETEFYKIDDGREIKEGDEGMIMVGSEFKKESFLGKSLRVGDKININGFDFQIKGIFKSVGNPSDDKLIYFGSDDFKKVFNSGDRVDQIIVQIENGENINDVAERVDKKLRSFRNVDEKTKDFTILTPEELLKSFGQILNIISGFLISVAAISLLVGGIGIANTMYTSVLERTKEIGVMKAIGAKNSDILSIFLIESGLLGLIGGVIGVGLGIGIGKIIEYIAVNQLGTNLLKISLNPYLIFGCLLFAFLIGIISGFFPAWQAGKIKIVDVLRYE